MLTVITILFSVVIIFLFIEYQIHLHNLNSIRFRIHVNGTRGKSSVTRLIAGALREHGIRTYAKTTGTLPRMIMEDGREYPIYRPSGANIIEQLRIVSLAARNKADAIVVECMALQPILQSITELKFIRATHGVISCRSIAASLGGEGDRAMGTTRKARNALRSAIRRNTLRFIEADSIEESMEERMNIFQEHAQGELIKVYVNVGGGRASVGPRTGKKRYKPGLNRRPSQYAMKVDSVTTRFARDNTPIIHIYRINDLAEIYGLPKSPKVTPKVGGGHIFTKLEYNLFLVTVNLVLLLFISYLFLKLDIGYRIFGSRRITEAPKHPEPMV